MKKYIKTVENKNVLKNMVIRINLNGRDLKTMIVTDKAKQRLASDLHRKGVAPGEALRIILLSAVVRHFMLVLDREAEGDVAIRDRAGRKILLVGSDLADTLNKKVLDYQENNPGFTLKERQIWEKTSPR